jgi:hypothetical protein
MSEKSVKYLNSDGQSRDSDFKQLQPLTRSFEFEQLPFKQVEHFVREISSEKPEQIKLKAQGFLYYKISSARFLLTCSSRPEKILEG